MTKADFLKKITAIAKYNDRLQAKASADIRRLYAQAVKNYMATGEWDSGQLDAEVSAIVNGSIYTAADKLDALQYQYYSQALKKNGWEPMAMPGRVFTKNGKAMSLPTWATQQKDLSSSVWGNSDEVKAKVNAIVAFDNARGADYKEISDDLSLYCQNNGGKKLAKKINRLYNVKNADGKISDSRYDEGWRRDWLVEYNEQTGQSIEFGSPEYERVFSDEGGQQWIDTHSVNAQGRRLLPNAHKEFVKRLGQSNVDYQAARVMRTERAAAYNETMINMGNGPLSSGRFIAVLDQRRDAWKCKCKQARDDIYNNGDGRELEYIKTKWGEYPLHPNCILGSAPVKTLRGDIPIENISMSDYVLANDGLYHAIDAISCYRYNGIMYGAYTADHLINTEAGWVEAANVSSHDRVMIAEPMSVIRVAGETDIDKTFPLDGNIGWAIINHWYEPETVSAVVWCIKVHGADNFFADYINVHNCQCYLKPIPLTAEEMADKVVALYG